jgi:hypothetical protein
MSPLFRLINRGLAKPPTEPGRRPRSLPAVDVISRIRIGMTRDEVIEALGPPDDVGVTSRKHRTPSIFKYGEIELHFEPWKDGKLIRAYTEDEHRNGIVLLE